MHTIPTQYEFISYVVLALLGKRNGIVPKCDPHFYCRRLGMKVCVYTNVIWATVTWLGSWQTMLYYMYACVIMKTGDADPAVRTKIVRY